MSDVKPNLPLSRDPRTGWILLAVALGPGGWLLWEIHRTIGLNAPRFWELLRTDRVFDIAMLDFVLTAAWAFFVMIERRTARGWRFWIPAAVFMVIPSVGIALYLILGAGRTSPPASGMLGESASGGGAPGSRDQP